MAEGADGGLRDLLAVPSGDDGTDQGLDASNLTNSHLKQPGLTSLVSSDYYYYYYDSYFSKEI